MTLEELLRNASPEVLQMNGLLAAQEGRSGATCIKGYDSDTKGSTVDSSPFLAVWEQCGGLELEAEYKFHPTRRWRFDYAHVGAKVAIELEGGVYSRGRHTRGAGYVGDCHKYNAATLLGWRVFRLATGMVTAENIRLIVGFISNCPTDSVPRTMLPSSG